MPGGGEVSLKDGKWIPPSPLKQCCPKEMCQHCTVDWTRFVFQGKVRAAPDVIWHIYSGQHCFKGDGGMDLPSSGEIALTTVQVPCEFQADRTGLIFQGKLRVAQDMIWHIYLGSTA